MRSIYYEKNLKDFSLEGKKVAVIGYGSQGHAHAQNLRDSGVDVTVGLYPGSQSAQKAEQDGFCVKNTSEAVSYADITAMLVPDEVQAEIFLLQVAPYLKDGSALMFAHGFNIHYGLIEPNRTIDVFMVAPKSPGHLVRRTFEQGKGVPSLFAVHNNISGNAQKLALAYAKGIGSGRAGILPTTFKEETETDLFGEQAVLCGGLTELIKAGFETLVDEGYQPEAAYFECLHEMKLIVDLLHEGGFEKMRDSISDTAEFGDYTASRRIIGDSVRTEMKQVLNEIQDGTFAKKWITENKNGRKWFEETRKTEKEHLIVQTGKKLRSLML